jgi:hypothetical protein
MASGLVIIGRPALKSGSGKCSNSHFPPCFNQQQKRFCNTEKILLLTNYFNFRAQLSVLHQVIGRKYLPNCRYPSF